jgi:hypothetical protein
LETVAHEGNYGAQISILIFLLLVHVYHLYLPHEVDSWKFNHRQPDYWFIIFFSQISHRRRLWWWICWMTIELSKSTRRANKFPSQIARAKWMALLNERKSNFRLSFSLNDSVPESHSLNARHNSLLESQSQLSFLS